jgi:hypothetical protein
MPDGRFQPLNNWTDEQNAELRQLCREHSLPTIVERLGRPYQQVKYQIRKLGLHTQAVGERKLKELAAIFRYSEKYGIRRTAVHFQVSEDVVSNIRRRYRREVTAITQELSPEELVKIRKGAMWKARSKGKPDHGEDFGSFAVLHRLTHTGGLNLDFLWGNYATVTFGDPKTSGGRIERMQAGRYLEITDAPDYDQPSPGVQVASPTPSAEETFSGFGVLAEKYRFDGLDRIIFFLYFKWGLNQTEIAEVVDHTQSRISQLVGAMQVRIKQDLESARPEDVSPPALREREE